MSCAACSSRVEKAVSGVSGVSECSVNLLTNSMTVEGTASSDEIISAVKKAGYGAETETGNKGKTKKENHKENNEEFSGLKKRLISSVIFLIILMYFSMGHMLSLPFPEFLEKNHIAIGIIQLLFTIVIMFINRKFFISGFKGVINKAPNMDTLVAMGSGAAFIYSLYALFMMTDSMVSGNTEAVAGYMHELYFESAAMILTLITVGKTLEAFSKGKTTNAIKGLLELAPETATVLKDGKEEEIPIDDVKKGDIFVVRPGGKIPVDGIILDGNTAVNESALTGESIPADKEEGDSVSAATINLSGYIKCKAERVGEDTTLSQIVKMVSDAAATKAPISKIADKVSGIFVPTVMIIAVITAVVWLFAGESFGFALARGISVLVISCPCALGLATPVAIMVGSGVGAKNGILFKTAAALEETGKIKTVTLDKTGTITEGTPVVTDIFPEGNTDRAELLKLAASLEAKSEHPLAKAVISEAEKEKTEISEAEDFKILPGNGLTATLNGKSISGGNIEFIRTKAEISERMNKLFSELSSEGKTPLFFSEDGVLKGIIAVADTIKKDSPQAVKELREMKIKTVMLTGDNKRTAEAIAEKVKTDEVIAGVLPGGKEDVIIRLRENGKVAMVGDGINDAPALTRADVGIAIGAGTDIAIDAADVVLVNGKLTDVSAAIRLGKSTLRNIKENLFWAFFYNSLGIPLAAGVFIPIFGWQLNPMFAAAAMSLSSFCVVVNALRLNFIKVHPNKIKIKTEEKTMILKINGMMCNHCKAHVEEALKNTAGVTSFEVDLEKGEAEVKGTATAEALKNAVKNAGYEVTDIKE